MIINGKSEAATSLARLLAALAGRLDDEPGELRALRWAMKDAEAEAERWGLSDLTDPLLRVALMTELSECLAAEHPAEAGEILAFCSRALSGLGGALIAGEVEGEATRIDRESWTRWGRYLAILLPGEAPDAMAASEADDAPPEIAPEQLLRMMVDRTFRPAPKPAPVPPLAPKPLAAAPPKAAPPKAAPVAEPPAARAPEPAAPAPEAPAPEPTEPAGALPAALLDPEVREAYRADAEDLLGRLSVLAPAVGREAEAVPALHEVGRCLHTLKGASGAVGLLDLAAFIHGLEDRCEAAIDSPKTRPGVVAGIDELLLRVEEILAALRPPEEDEPPDSGSSPHSPPDRGPSPPAADPDDPFRSPVPSDPGPSEAGEMVRVPRARLDELMDLAAELFVQNGPRTILAGKVKEFATLARSCRNRLGVSVDRLCNVLPAQGSAAAVDREVQREAIGLIRQLSEQADDLSVLAESARSAATPLADDAEASARLARQMWDLLHEIRVVPIRPLFYRLARVAEAAARLEGKRVEVVLRGEEIGLDRLVQDKVFEPLLHTVRNAIGHGIEAPEARRAAGKPPAGRLELSVDRDADSLWITVRDDGRGLDRAAIAAKARRLGLLAPGENPAAARLDALVFRPGFSTRDDVNAVSGRGIGMDVVAREIARLNGEVMLDSEPGVGTALTVRLPARLALEKVMVVRADGQAFALPLTSIVGSADPGADLAPVAAVLSARDALGLPAAAPGSASETIRVRVGGECFDVAVDAVIGPMELVVKPLNPLVSGHPAIAGTSLSADGELIFVTDAAGLVRSPRGAAAPRPSPVLVVDDSISVRRSVIRHLNALGLEADEAFDGVEALRKLHDRPYCLIVTDIDMPRMDGFQLLTELGRERAFPAAPAVVASSRSDAETRRRVRELGASAFVAKPVGLEELAEVITPLLNIPPA